MGRNLASLLSDTAARQGDRPAVKLDDVTLSYAMLDEGSARVAAFLHEQGFQPGDRVGLMLPNVPHFPLVYHGVLRAGGVVVPMNVLLREREIAFYLEDSEASLLFAWQGFVDEAGPGAAAAGTRLITVEPEGFLQQVMAIEPLREVAEVDDEDTAVILYTSGTTGHPKGAELTHGNLLSNAMTTVTTLIEVKPEDVVLGALPLFHSFGQTCALNACVAGGGCLTLLPRFDPTKALEIVQRDRVTIFEGVPTMYAALLNHEGREAYDFSALRLCVSGGSAMPGEVLRGFEEAFGCVIVEGYGLSETSPVASFNHPDRARKVGSIGTPIAGVEMRIVDGDGADVEPGGDRVGEIAIHGPNVMKGYWRQPEATAEAIRDGWFYTGDLATVDDEGYFFIVDRRKDMIIRGGYNVYPREVEEVLYEHPAVAEVAVIGVPHEEWGEEVAAAVALKAGASADEATLREFCRARVAAYKYPRRIWFVETLPKGATGKILKREIEIPAA